MASFWYYEGVDKILEGTVDVAADTIKVGLSTSVHLAGLTDTLLDDGTADDFTSGELSVTGYIAGYANSGRQTLASKTFLVDSGTNQARFDAADPAAWTLATGATVEQAMVYKHPAAASDTTCIPLVNLDFTGVPTNGGTFTLQFAATGIGVCDCG